MWFCFISCGDRNIFLQQWMVSFSTFCFPLSSKLTTVLVNRAEEPALCTSIPTSLTRSWISYSTKRGTSHLYLFSLVTQQSETEKKLVTKIIIPLWTKVSCTSFLLGVFGLSRITTGQCWSVYMTWTEHLAFSTTFQLPKLFFFDILTVRINYHFSSPDALRY